MRVNYGEVYIYKNQIVWIKITWEKGPITALLNCITPLLPKKTCKMKRSEVFMLCKLTHIQNNLSAFKFTLWRRTFIKVVESYIN